VEGLKGKMNICSCGGLFDDQYTQCPRCEALQVFGLGADATETEIKNAYRLFVKAWSPDSLQGDLLLKAAAEDKLKDIHAAFEYLTMTSTERAQQQRPVYLTARKASPGTTPDAAPPSRRASPGYTTLVVLPSTAPPQAPPQGLWQRTKSLLMLWKRSRLIFGVAAFALVILTGRSIWTFLRTHNHDSGQWASINAVQSAPNAAEGPKSDSPDALKQKSPVPGRSGSAPKSGSQAAQRAPQTAVRKIYPYITVGSTKDEVLDELGTPTASSEDKLVYGKSELYLKDNSVIGWRVDPFSSPIRVKLWPEAPVDTSLDYFTVGSSKDVVLVVQGTPTAFSEDKFEYGGSEVYFQNNRVVRWRNDPVSIPLRARLN